MNEGGSIIRSPLASNTSFDAAVEGLPRFVWGSLLWAIRGGSGISPEPPAPSDAPERCFWAIIQLCQMHAAAVYPQSWDVTWFIDGDSDFTLQQVLSRENTLIEIGLLRTTASFEIRPNSFGRAGSVVVKVPSVRRATDAYRVAQGIFDFITMHLIYQTDVPLRQSAILVYSEDGSEAVARWRIGFPLLPFDLGTPRPVLFQRLLSFYAEGVRSNSPFYSFLCYFSLLEFLLGPCQGAFRKVARKYRIEIIDLKGSLASSDIVHMAPWLKDKPYHQLLKDHRKFRLHIAHFSIAISPRPFVVTAEDDVALARDLFRLACKDLLEKCLHNLQTLDRIGATDLEIEGEMVLIPDR